MSRKSSVRVLSSPTDEGIDPVIELLARSRHWRASRPLIDGGIVPCMLYCDNTNVVMVQFAVSEALLEHVTPCQLSPHGKAKDSTLAAVEVKFQTAPSDGGCHSQLAPLVALYRLYKASYSCSEMEQFVGIDAIT